MVPRGVPVAKKRRRAPPSFRLTARDASVILPAMRTSLRVIVTVLMITGLADAAEKDLRRRLESQRAAVEDLKALDQTRAAEQEIALLRNWLDEAWTQLAREEEDTVRMLLDRCDAQAVYIREAIQAAKAKADADKTEAAVRASRAKVEKTREDLKEAEVKKKALEMNLR